MKKYDNITKNFKYYEFWSSDKKLGKNSIEPPEQFFEYIYRCAWELQKVRDIIKRPIIITSAYRTPEWNEIIGGVENSYHLRGMAVDTRPIGMNLLEYFSYLLRYTKFNGFGYYRRKNFVHSDLRKKFTVFRY